MHMQDEAWNALCSTGSLESQSKTNGFHVSKLHIYFEAVRLAVRVRERFIMLCRITSDKDQVMLTC